MDLIEKDENLATACHLTQSDTFSTANISACEKYVLKIQRRLDKAVANDDKPNIRWYTHLLMKRSRAVKILSVHRVCSINQGKHTAGVDGIAIPKDKERRIKMKIELLNSIDINKTPDQIRRVYIPKPNGDKRPLGIPTITDRINQDIIRQSIEPICEYHFLNCSYGFRPKRSCQDAMSDLFNKLRGTLTKEWIIEGDIKGCFDNINHDHIINTLREWRVSKSITQIIKSMLKADIMIGVTITPSESGTPQGGIISPMLANVALTCLDEEIIKRYPSRGVSTMVRYADDFIIVAETEQQAKVIRKQVKVFLKQTIGVELSENKTFITHISKGFDFLGFNFKKYKDKLLIKPSKENIKGVRRKIANVIKNLSGAPIEKVITNLNPIIAGWGNYYRFCVATPTFSTIDSYTWNKMWKWTAKKHPTRGGKYRRDLYLNSWQFYDRDTHQTLSYMRKIPTNRFVKVKRDKRVYDAETKLYWENREYKNAKNSIHGSKTLTLLFKAQIGRCAYCNQPITDSDVKGRAIHKHHLKPKSEGGNWKLNNLRILHSDCHTSLHSIYSRKEMADLIDKGIDYVRLMKPKP